MSEAWDMFEGMEDYGHDWPGIYRDPMTRVNTSVKIVSELQRREKFTPDFKKLKQFDNILVFVYDDLKFGGSQDTVLSESAYLGEATSAHDMYSLKGYRLPVLLNNNVRSSPSRGKIKGELYAVPPETILQLDKLKRNGVLFKREQRTFFLIDQKYKTKKGVQVPSVKAWVYMGIPEVWKNDYLPIMAQFSHVGNKDRKFFYYSPSEYREDLDKNVG